MAIDFTLPPDVVRVRERVRDFMRNEVAPAEARFARDGGWRKGLAELRERARAAGLWAPHMPPEYGGMGLGPLAMAFVSAECGRTMMGAYILNCPTKATCTRSSITRRRSRRRATCDRSSTGRSAPASR